MTRYANFLVRSTCQLNLAIFAGISETKVKKKKNWLEEPNHKQRIICVRKTKIHP